MTSNVGAYELEAELGRGGMGRVYRARHLPTGAVRALKVLIDRSDPEAVARFRLEAEALARSGAHGVVAVHEAGVHEGCIYYVMDLMSGGSLADRIKLRGRAPWHEAVALVAPLARTLGRYHAAGFVHRDVKPANVLFDDEGRPSLADFGCVRDLGSDDGLTASGTFIGTPAYAAPEQLMGDKVQAPADVFALGVLLHELVTGARPFEETTAFALVQAIQEGKRRPLTESDGVPDGLALVLSRALEAKPEDRFKDGTALAGALELLLRDVSVRRKGPRPSSVALGLGGLLLALVAVLLSRRGPASPLVPPPPNGHQVPTPSVLTSRATPARPLFRITPKVLEERAALDNVARRAIEKSDYEPGILAAREAAETLGVAWARAVEAELLFEAGDLESAKRLAVEALTRDPCEGRAYGLLADMILKREERMSVLALATLAIACGDGVRARVLRAHELTEVRREKKGRDDPDELALITTAIDDLLQAKKLGGSDDALAPFFGEAYQLRARARDRVRAGAVESQEDRAQEAVWKEVKRKAGPRPELALMEELTAAAKKSAPGGLELANKVLAMNPRRGAAWAARGRIRSESFVRTGDVSLLDPAIADLEEGFRLDRRAHKVRETLLMCLETRSRIRRNAGDFTGELADLARRIVIDPTKLSSYVYLAWSQEAQGDVEAAADTIMTGYEGVVRGDVSGTELARLLRLSTERLLRRGDLDGAYESASRHIAAAPEEVGPWAARANVSMQRGDPYAAWADADHAILLDPNLAEAYRIRGYVRTNRDDEGAISDLERYLELVSPASEYVPGARRRLEALRARGR